MNLQQAIAEYNDAKVNCWRIIYDDLLKAIDANLMEQLIVVGCAANKSFDEMADDILKREVDCSLFDQLAEKYCISN